MNVTMIGRLSGHLDDDAFAELWANAMAEGAPVAGHPHLQECAECRLRLAAFSSWLDDLRVGARTDAEGALPADRLAAQQAQILRRLEAAERPARVIAFPKHPVDGPRPVSIRGWIAGAAAAAFIAGLGLGQLLNVRQLSSEPSTFPADRMVDVRDTATEPRTPTLVSITDDDYLAEFEDASTPRYEALRAYDTYTPRAADFVTSSRIPR